MSVGVCVAGEGGVVLATDSRRSLQIGNQFSTESEEARKLFIVRERFAVATYGKAVIDGKTIGALMEDFDEPEAGGTIGLAKALGEWFGRRLSDASPSRRGDFLKKDAMEWQLGFVLSGFDDGVAHAYEVKVRPGDWAVQVLEPSTDNPGVYPFASDDGIQRLLSGVDRKALREAGINLSSEDKKRLRLLSYELAIPKELSATVGFAQSLVYVQFLAQEISYGTFVNEASRVKGCGGTIKTATVSEAGAAWGPTLSLPTDLPGLPSQAGGVPRSERRSA
jgi:hypothetical protein